ncbi:MAG: hypothetical protein WC307_00915 [Candidatus Nanoarchaeia archaeon]|jgi:hypothetical protein
MIKEHYAFITISLATIFLISGLTISGVNQEITGYYVNNNSCEPMTCEELGLEPTGFMKCEGSICYRNCYQDSVLIEMATFCER